MVPTLYISKEQVLFGNLAFVKIDEEGYTVWLDKEDIERLLRYIENQKEIIHSWTVQQINQQHKILEVQENIA